MSRRPMANGSVSICTIRRPSWSVTSSLACAMRTIGSGRGSYGTEVSDDTQTAPRNASAVIARWLAITALPSSSSPPESDYRYAKQESRPNARQRCLELLVDEQGKDEQPEQRHPQPHRPTLDRGRLTPAGGRGRAAPEADQGVVGDLGLTVGALHEGEVLQKSAGARQTSVRLRQGYGRPAVDSPFEYSRRAEAGRQEDQLEARRRICRDTRASSINTRSISRWKTSHSVGP